MLIDEEGFTLVEVLAALIILSVAVLPIVNYFTNTIGIVHQSETMSQAADIALGTMEILKSGELDNNLNIDMTAGEPSDSTEAAIYNYVDSGFDEFADYTIEIDLYYLSTDLSTSYSTEPVDYNEDLRKIEVKVSWPDDNEYILDSIVRVR